jgi:hypothetical protein
VRLSPATSSPWLKPISSDYFLELDVALKEDTELIGAVHESDET